MVQLLGLESLDILRLLFLLLVVAGDVERNPGPTNADAGEGQLCLEQKIFFISLTLSFFPTKEGI